jgi:hypothetical protein
MRVLSLLFLLLPVGPLFAQSVEGRLLESETGTPIILGQVTLLLGNGTVADQTYTDEAGFFSVWSPEPGSFFLRAEHVGFFPRVDGLFELGAGGVLTVEFRLRANLMVMDTLAVEVERRDLKLNLLGYYDRERRGFGRFMGPEEIAQRPIVDVTDLFRNIPRVRVNWKPFGGTTVTMAGAGSRSLMGGACYPKLIVDGMEIFRGGEEPTRIDEVVFASEIRGLEIYRGPAEVPLQFGGANSSCGVILIWTR